MNDSYRWEGDVGSKIRKTGGNDKPHFEGENFGLETECPKIIAWAKRCTQRKSVSKSLKDEKKVLGFVQSISSTLMDN
ncbi:hypothetical protein CUMW_167690 [Citrus unshiu]|nr:hypothetical protein CUMW_167690 [Citrus unshiu]